MCVVKVMQLFAQTQVALMGVFPEAPYGTSPK